MQCGLRPGRVLIARIESVATNHLRVLRWKIFQQASDERVDGKLGAILSRFFTMHLRRLPIPKRDLSIAIGDRHSRLREKLLKACRQNDSQTAYAAWYQLYRLGQANLMHSEKIKTAVSELEQHLNRTLERQWSEVALARALRQSRRRYRLLNWQLQQCPKYRVPPLNP